MISVTPLQVNKTSSEVQSPGTVGDCSTKDSCPSNKTAGSGVASPSTLSASPSNSSSPRGADDPAAGAGSSCSFDICCNS